MILEQREKKPSESESAQSAETPSIPKEPTDSTSGREEKELKRQISFMEMSTESNGDTFDQGELVRFHPPEL